MGESVTSSDRQAGLNISYLLMFRFFFRFRHKCGGEFISLLIRHDEPVIHFDYGMKPQNSRFSIRSIFLIPFFFSQTSFLFF